jgi:hypothetical protein
MASKPASLLKIQELLQVVGGARNGSSEAELRDVVGEYAVDAVEFGGREGLLGLDDFDVVGDAGLETLTREVEGFFADLKIPLG